MPVPIRPRGLLLSFFNSNHITSILTVPPQRLIQKAVKPLVIPAKPAFKITIKNASGKPRAETVNIVTILESPGFAPGGRNGNAGKSDSSQASARPCAPSMPTRAIRFAFAFLFKISPYRINRLLHLYLFLRRFLLLLQPLQAGRRLCRRALSACLCLRRPCRHSPLRRTKRHPFQ